MEERNSDQPEMGNEDKEGELDSSFISGADEILDDLIEDVVSRVDVYSNRTSSKQAISGPEKYDDFEDKFNELFLQVQSGVGKLPWIPRKSFEAQEPINTLLKSSEFSLSFDKNLASQKDSCETQKIGKTLDVDYSMLEEVEAADVLCLIQILIDENKALQKQMNKMGRTVRLVMSNYRKSMTLLLNELEDSKKLFSKINEAIKIKNEKCCAKIDQIELEMREVMRLAIQLDGHHGDQHVGNFAKLQYENRGLRELLGIKATFEGNFLHSNKSTQTEIIDEQKNSGASDIDHVDSDNDDGINSVSSQDSFHSAVEVRSPLRNFSPESFAGVKELGISEDEGDVSSEMKNGVVDQFETGLDGSGDSEST